MSISYRSIILSLFIILITSIKANVHNLSGIVIDNNNKEALELSTIEIKPGNRIIQTDTNGKFSIKLEAGIYKLSTSYIGYSPKEQTITITQDTYLKILLDKSDKTLKEVTITAKESTGITSSSTINKNAMSHLQPTSFTDLLELLPGNISQTPNMGSASTINLRETGTYGAAGGKILNSDYNITSLGTLFVIDGAPINTDTNMQNIPSSDNISSKDITNRGVDMRTISTDNIESVEIVRGIPSVEYGNLTSGLVNIKRGKNTTPFTARFKADGYSKMIAAGKGFYVGNYNSILNLDGGYLDSKIDPRNNLENYKRINLSARYNLNIKKERYNLSLSPSIDYTGSFDNTKEDPDLSYNKINEYKSSYNKIATSNNLALKFNNENVINKLELTLTASYEKDRLERKKQVAPQRASIAPTSMNEGVHDGVYLLNEYIANYICDGQPISSFVKLKATGNTVLGKLTNDYKLGGEWSIAKNLGEGQIYDLLKPLSASWTTRPRRYNEIPALHTLSFYVENNMKIALGSNILKIQAGIRSIQMPHLSNKYDLANKIYLDPRANVLWDFPEINIAGRSLKLLLVGGYGLTTKMPTADYLYPQTSFYDIIQLNYYDITNPHEHSKVSLMTYKDDATNYNLKAARNKKWELRLGADIGKNRLSITYFNEYLNSGFRYSSVYQTYNYRKYDSSGINSSTLEAAPNLEDLSYTDKTIIGGYSKVTNGSTIKKEGIEFQFNSARIEPIHTSIIVNGAWFKSTYSNSQMLYIPVNTVIDNQYISNRYVGLYNCNDGRKTEQINTNFMFDTQIPDLGVIFSTTIQCMWNIKTTKLWQNGVPDYYLDVADGQLHAYTEESKNDKYLKYLITNYNNDMYRPNSIPTAIYLNLKATKQIGRTLRIAAFTNKMLDYLPSYKSNGVTIRRSSKPYFGMEINILI